MKLRFLLLLLFLIPSWPEILLAESAPPILTPVSIHFVKGTAIVDPTGIDTIKELAAKVANFTITNVLVEGFSDSTPLGHQNSYASNKELSKARADSVVLALVHQAKLSKDIFTIQGMGAQNFIAPNDTKEGRSKNRRVEVRVFGKKITKKDTPKTEKLLSLSLRDVEISEAYEMLAKSNRVNIVLEKGVSGKVSLNLFDLQLKEIINLIATSAGFTADQTARGYTIHHILPKVSPPEIPIKTEVRTYKVKYSPSDKIEKALTDHLSENGKITALKGRNIIIIKDTPAALDKMELILQEIDKEPKEFLIEAKILEITLDDTESFGLDWSKIFNLNDNILGTNSEGSIGVNGLTNATTGFIFHVINDNVNITLDALKEKGRVKTLSTPKLLTIANQKASVIIGDRKGYNVTTTINQVTTTSVEFLESGIILDVTPSVDNQGRILLIIHPEVSSGSISSVGIPSQTTTEVSTTLLADNGQTVFIGGLLKQKSDNKKAGVPLLGDIPILGRAFSNSKDIQEMTETVVLITPHIITHENTGLMDEELNKVKAVEFPPRQ